MRTDAMNYYRLEKDFTQAGFYETPQHKCLFTEIRAAIKKGELIAISGVIGSGKTVMLSKLKDTCNRSTNRTLAQRAVNLPWWCGSTFLQAVGTGLDRAVDARL